MKEMQRAGSGEKARERPVAEGSQQTDVHLSLELWGRPGWREHSGPSPSVGCLSCGVGGEALQSDVHGNEGVTQSCVPEPPALCG